MPKTIDSSLPAATIEALDAVLDIAPEDAEVYHDSPPTFKRIEIDDTPISVEVVPESTSTALANPEALTSEQLEEIDAERRQSIGKGKGHELSNWETMRILEMYHKEKKTQMEIARYIHCNQSTVSKIINKYRSTTDLGKMLLQANAMQLVEKLVQTENPKVIAKVLAGLKGSDGTRLIEAERDFGGPAGPAGNQIFVGVKVNLGNKS